MMGLVKQLTELYGGAEERYSKRRGASIWPAGGSVRGILR